MPKDLSDRAWSGKTGGFEWQQRFLISFFKRINPVITYPFIWIWVLAYIFFRPKTRKGILHYWQLQGRSGFSAWLNMYLNYVEFGKAIMDRFAAYGGREIQIDFEGIEIFDKLQSSESGFILFNSHIGNPELAGYHLMPQKPMFVLSFDGDTQTVNKSRSASLQKMGIDVIPLKQDGSHIIEMHNAISNGSILSIHADRLFAADRKIRASLLNHEASFPAGPFRFAASEMVPVVCLFMIRTGNDKYQLSVRNLSDGIDWKAGRKEVCIQLLARYKTAMEETLQRFPRQWFHFYDFWEL